MWLIELGTKYIRARVGHPQTNGKIERWFGEVQRKLPLKQLCRVSDPVDLFVHNHNYERPHMSLGKGGYEAPHEAFSRKMPREGTIIDESSRDEYRVN